MQINPDAVRAFLRTHPVLYAATMGLNRQPQVHPVELCLQEEDAFYFAVPKCEALYGELSLHPQVTLCVSDRESRLTFRLEGVAVFTEDGEILSRCLRECASLRERWGGTPEMLIPWFLRDGKCVFRDEADGTEQALLLGTPENALVGIRISKKTELRDRLSAILAEREAQTAPPEDMELQRLYDGALIYFAETAKAMWPRMDIRPIERSALFDTYDQREQFASLAKRLIGNVRIDKPEDLTHWLSPETLNDLRKQG